ncbi:MAG: 3D domain-containing protein [Desulfosporosinus sp.]|nr:3D domain-containing protein [Desulfosporosinus sp.]
MYSLPITTYSDYWRATKLWSSYLGGLAIFAAGTQYSTLSAPDRTQTLQMPLQLTIQSSNTKELGTEISFLDLQQRALSRGLASRGVSILGSTISRGATSQGPASRGLTSLGATSQGETSQEEASQEGVSQGEMNLEKTSQSATDQEAAGQKFISGITCQTQVEEKEIPFETQFIESDKLLPGMSQIQEEGENGMLSQVVRTFGVDGQPINQQVQSSFELKRPKKKVIIRNSKPVVGEVFELEKMKISQTLNVESTAYTYTGNKTATGLTAREGLIAVDPKIIAMGSKVYVEGYGYAIAADTGGDIRGNRIDVFFSTLRQCLDWGRKPVHIYILKSN